MEEKKRKRGTGWVWAVVVAMALGCLAGGCCVIVALLPRMDGLPAEDVPVTLRAVAPAATVTPAATATPAAALTLADRVAREARSYFGDRLRQAGTLIDDESVAAVEYDLGTVWDEASAARSAAADFLRFAPGLFEAVDGITALDVRAMAEFEQADGSQQDEIAFRFILTAEGAAGITWDNITSDEVGRALDSQAGCGVVVHPALKAAWEEYQE